jgi:hypothetical protein
MVVRREKWILSGCALLAALALAVQGFSQQKKPGEKPAPQEKLAQQAGKPGEQVPGAPDMEEMMKKWQELNALGPQQQDMAKAAGKYDVLVRWWAVPGQPPEESKGFAEFRVVLGGHFLEQRFAGEMMGQPYEGLGFEGYDTFKKQYQSAWLDSMTNAMMYATGTGSEDGKVITYTAKIDDPLTGQKDKPVRMVVRKISDDKAIWEMFETLPDGKEVKTMEMEYTRRK